MYVKCASIHIIYDYLFYIVLYGYFNNILKSMGSFKKRMLRFEVS